MNGRFFCSLSGHWPRGACFDGVPASTPQSHGAQAAWIHAPTRPLLPAEGPFSPRPSVSRAVRLSEFVAPSGDDGSVGPRYCRTSHIAAPASTSALNFPAYPVNDPQPSGPCISCTSWESLLDNWSSTDDRARTSPVLIGNDDAKMKTVMGLRRFRAVNSEFFARSLPPNYRLLQTCGLWIVSQSIRPERQNETAVLT